MEGREWGAGDRLEKLEAGNASFDEGSGSSQWAMKPQEHTWRCVEEHLLCEVARGEEWPVSILWGQKALVKLISTSLSVSPGAISHWHHLTSH